MSTVNIIMSAYNGERFIGEQIESIIASVYTDWSLFICDDGSTDGTIGIINKYIEQYSDRIHLSKNNSNLGSTRTFLNGLKRLTEHSNGIPGESLPFTSNNAQYFMFCDQDDVWLKDKLERTVAGMTAMEKKHGKNVPALVFTDAVVVDEKLTLIKQSFIKSSRLNTRMTTLGNLLMENKCIGCTTMVNRALAEMIVNIPANIRYHDWWVALVAASFGNIQYIPVQSMLYRQHGGNQVGDKGFCDYVRDRGSRLNMQKEVLELTRKQAEAFYNEYGDSFNEKNKKIISTFISLNEKGWFGRRYYAVKYGFVKSGLVRNIGLMLII